MVRENTPNARDENESFDRRRLLQWLGGAGAISLAGCTGGDGGDGGSGADGESGGDGSADGSSGDGDAGGDGESTEQSDTEESGGDGDSGESAYPERDIEVVVPFSSGGGTDYYARLVAKYLPKHLPNNVNTVVRNVTGGGGRTAANQVFTSGEPGYTILQGHLEVHTIGQLMFDTQYDVAEFAQLGSSAKATRCWFGRVDVNEEYDTWDKVAEGLGSGDLIMASQGTGNTAHLAGLIYGELSGAYNPDDVSFVHHDGSGPMIPTMRRGDAHLSMGTFSTALNQVEGVDELAIFAVLDTENEDYQSQEEWGVPSDVASRTRNMFTNQRALWAPPETSEEHTQILRDGIWNALHDEELLAEAEEADRPIIPTKGSDMDAVAAEFIENWQEYLDILEQTQG